MGSTNCISELNQMTHELLAKIFGNDVKTYYPFGVPLGFSYKASIDLPPFMISLVFRKLQKEKVVGNQEAGLVDLI